MLAVVFVSGLLLGLAADSNLSAEPPAVVATASEGDEPEAEPRRRYIYEQVEPTPEQSALIDSMMNDYRESRGSLEEELRKGYRELRSTYDPQYQRLVRDIRGAIKDVLSEEQAAEYQVLLDDFDRRRADRNENDDRD
jgi:Spy/CpxP family protein refolding chaperone